ncbi:MAG: T9SS type A sorting domain-containing protein, partial [Bacteroidota bacterium]
VVSVATDPDGPGPSGLVAQPISLDESTQYELSITLANTFDMEDITAEILEEDDEHQFFFGFAEDLFDRPNGDGNLDNEADPILYNDEDDNGLPLGLSTTWITACTNDGDATGKFRVILKHQPGQKTATSDINVGGTDIDIEWDITIVDNPDAPDCENEEEEINEVVFTFTPAVGGDPVVSTATDPDGPGPAGLVAQPISLDESTQYELSITLANTFDMEDITAEILEEDDEHQFFFGFAEDLFDRPNGDGNLDNEADPIIYNDEDDNGLPLGLSTTWITACTNDGNSTGKFRVILKHQPGEKTATSDINVGGTDIDIEWDITIVDNPDAPDCENEEEEINEVVFTFIPAVGGDPVVSIATDPDGPGPSGLVAQPISLDESKQYELQITLANTFDMEDITAEILEEDDEHQFFFGFSEDLFDRPNGDGNLDNEADPILYNDEDDNGLPLGLSTTWITACTNDGDVTGKFRVILKHQPGQKTATSDINVGGTDIDIEWDITVVDNSDASDCENEEEEINEVMFIFTPMGGGDPIISTATDPDGPGPASLTAEDIDLAENTEYELSIKLANTFDMEDITAEILEEDDEHQFFFAWTGDIFSDPMGDGNIDNRDDPINYNDKDENDLPVGLSTNWTTSAAMTAGTLRVVLKHQPGAKNATSTFNDGGTDIDITFNINAIVSSTNNLRPDQRLTIAPNPVQNNLYFLTRNVDLSQSTMVIYNSVGAQVKTFRNPNNEINITDLAPGMYTVQIRGEKLRWNGRFIKTNN